MIKIALEAIKGQPTINKIASYYGVHPDLVTQWKRQAIQNLPEAFSSKRDREAEKEEALKAQLYQQIGRLKVELDWLKKNLDYSTEHKRLLIEPEDESISISRQCELIDLPRSSYYYEPRPESPENLHLMKLIDETFTDYPFFVVMKMTEWLRQKQDPVNPKRVRRLMRLMGLEAAYPKPRLSQPGAG